MKPHHIILFLALTLAFHSFSQEKIKTAKAARPANRLIGTWRLIEFADLDPVSSTWTYSYGKHPKGYFTYTRNGIVNLNICNENPFKISEDSAKNYPLNLSNWVDSIAVGYFGTYTVDLKNSIVVHHVKGGSMPWYIDTDQQRPFILKADTLIIGDNKTWKRVLVKED